MNPLLTMIINIMLIIILIIALVLALGYLFAGRQTKNLLVKLFKKKRYCIAYYAFQNTDFTEKHFVVPDINGFAKIRNRDYNFSPQYAYMKDQGRLCFLIDENDTIPRQFKKPSKEEIIFRADEVQAALDNDVARQLFTKKQEYMLFALFALVVIMLLVLFYFSTQINDLKDMIAAIPKPQVDSKIGSVG